MPISVTVVEVSVADKNTDTVDDISQGHSQKFAKGGTKQESEGRKLPSRVQGQSPGGGLGAKPPEAGLLNA